MFVGLDGFGLWGRELEVSTGLEGLSLEGFARFSGGGGGLLGLGKFNILGIFDSWKQVELFFHCTPFEAISCNVELKNGIQLRCGNFLCMHLSFIRNVVSNHCKALGLAILGCTLTHGPH